MQNIKLGYAFCGSFCTINKSLATLKELAKLDFVETYYTSNEENHCGVISFNIKIKSRNLCSIPAYYTNDNRRKK